MSFSDLWKRARLTATYARQTDRAFYSKVASELQTGVRDEALWLQAIEKTKGDETTARAVYIGLRVQMLKDEVLLFQNVLDGFARGDQSEQPPSGSKNTSLESDSSSENLHDPDGLQPVFLIIVAVLIGVLAAFWTSADRATPIEQTASSSQQTSESTSDAPPPPHDIPAASRRASAAFFDQELPDAPLDNSATPSERFNATFEPIERDFTFSVPNSSKFIQFRIAYKTFYGEKIVERVATHQVTIEAAIIGTAGQYSAEEMMSTDGRARLAAALRDAINDVLIRNEDFGGIEEVMFTHFVEVMPK